MEKIETKRHSYSHVLAAAVLALYPKAKLGIGPAIDNGFYYDFDLTKPLTTDDLSKIEKKMKEIITSSLKFEKIEESGPKAIKMLLKEKQEYKVELAEELIENKKQVSFYKMGKFTDLCAGPHVASTAELDPHAFKLVSVAGAYWRGSEKNPMLTRVYGVAFENANELENYLLMREEAEKRDHKKLGPELGIFMFHETAPGMPYWLPNGVTILNELVNFWREEHSSRGYQEVKTPLINKKELYETSGHWDHYREEMFVSHTEEKETYVLKPMNCPNAMVIYGNKKRSYRELPLRLGDTDTLHRNERSGTLNGLLRAREFSQDDAHIFITESQITDEIKRIFEIVERFYSVFGLNYSFRLGTRPDDFMGDKKLWDVAEKELEEVLKKSKKPYFILEGDGAFYGPKIDILMKDSLDREWQMGTIQLDFQIPRRFNLGYIDKDGKEKTPVVIHRVIYGSLERFMGILIEHFAGAFPLWIAPEQVRIVTVNDSVNKFAQEVAEELRKEGVRVNLDANKETVGKKIREAELAKIPYMVVIGEKEVGGKKLAVRLLKNKEIKEYKIDSFVKEIQEQIIKKA